VLVGGYVLLLCVIEFVWKFVNATLGGDMGGVWGVGY